jgi:hypothetical protein
MRSWLMSAAALVLTGCGDTGPVAQENAGAGLPDVAEVENATGVPLTPPPSDGGRPVGGGRPAASAAPGVAGTIPAFLHGRWGMTPADCTSTSGDAKGLLVIDGRALRFHESRAVPVGEIGGTPDSFTGDFTFTGKGETWTSYETLQIQDRRLVRTTSSPMASYTYAKCS